jgi:hypothetical protein
MDKNRYFLEIENTSGHYQGRYHHGDPGQASEWFDLSLGPEQSLSIKGQPRRFDELLQALRDCNEIVLANLLDERGQLEWGYYLYQQSLGRWQTGRLPLETTAQLHIVSEDEHILRLPWVLLARDGVFLTTTGWSVVLGRAGEAADCELPPSPQLLVIMPQPVGVAETQAEAHLEELQEMLSRADHHFYRNQHLHLASTWEECQQQIKARHHDLLYYYGHGVGDAQRSRLVFAAGPQHYRQDKPIADLAILLRQAPGGPPLLAYLNCCQGDAGGILGAGRQLLNLIPAVVSNRTDAYVAAARQQALAFWRAILLEGLPPHAAVAGLYQQLGDMDLSLQDVRWLTPVLHGHYRDWRANPPKPSQRLDRNPHWRLMLDRIRQFSTVFYQVQVMLRERKPRCHAYLWYGQAGQGVDLFHQRLTVELRQVLREVELYEVPSRWPDDLHNPHRSFQDMMQEAFRVNSLDDIPARIRTRTRGETGRSVLVYVRHEPVRVGDLIKPPVLRTYLEWWDSAMIPLLQESRAFGLLGISFIVNHPVKFRGLAEQQKKAMQLQHEITFNILDEMERLAREDLELFLNTHNIALPPKRRERILDEILEKTEGHYEMTLEELKSIEEQAWNLEEAAEQATEPTTSGDDY